MHYSTPLPSTVSGKTCALANAVEVHYRPSFAGESGSWSHAEPWSSQTNAAYLRKQLVAFDRKMVLLISQKRFADSDERAEIDADLELFSAQKKEIKAQLDKLSKK